ncbi:hypothetical protein LCGC14_2597550, partial [marine sediment metagenome]
AIVNNLIEAVGELLRFIADADVYDRVADDGEGHTDTWASEEFRGVVGYTAEKLNELKDDVVACEMAIDDGDYIISTKGLPIKLSVTVKGNMATYRDGGIGEVLDLRNWTFKRIEFRPPPDPESLTCFNCKNNDICKYANDPYNTNGDCLAAK